MAVLHEGKEGLADIATQADGVARGPVLVIAKGIVVSETPPRCKAQHQVNRTKFVLRA